MSQSRITGVFTAVASGAQVEDISLVDMYQQYKVTSGTISYTAADSLTIRINGTPSHGMVLEIEFDCDITLANSAVAKIQTSGAFAMSIKGDGSGTLPAVYANKKFTLYAKYTGSTWSVQYFPSVDETAFITSGMLATGLSATGIALAEGYILVGDSAGAAAAIDAATSGRILVGDGTTLASVAVSGDVTLAANGAVTIAANAVETAMIADDQVTNAKLAGITRGSIKYGNASGDPADLAVGASAQMLISDGTDPAWRSISGDMTISSTGVATIVGDGAVKTIKVTIPTASVLTLNATPVTVIPAQGAGTVIEVLSAVGYMDYNSATYAANGILRLLTTGAVIGQCSWTANGFLFGTAALRAVKATMTSPTAVGDTQLIANTAVVAQVDTGDPTTGDSDIILYVTYRVITL